MNELLKAAKAVIEVWDAGRGVWDQISALRAAVERAEKQEVATDFCEWWHSNDYGNYGIHHAQLAWTAAQQAERERIRARAKLAAEKTWKAGDWYIGPQHNMIEKFVEELLKDDSDE